MTGSCPQCPHTVFYTVLCWNVKLLPSTICISFGFIIIKLTPIHHLKNGKIFVLWINKNIKMLQILILFCQLSMSLCFGNWKSKVIFEDKIIHCHLQIATWHLPVPELTLLPNKIQKTVWVIGRVCKTAAHGYIRKWNIGAGYYI